MKTLITAVLCIAFTTPMLAQKVDGKVKSFSDIKGTEVVKVEFVYEDMKVGKYKTEAEYLENKVTELNEKEAGKGDAWKTSWQENRSGRYHPEFVNLLNEHAQGDVNFTYEEAESEYTMIVKTTHTEPGFNIGMMKKDAFVSLTIHLVKSDDKDNPISSVNLLKAPGRGGSGLDFDAAYRIEQAYGKAGKTLGKEMTKAGIL